MRAKFLTSASFASALVAALAPAAAFGEAERTRAPIQLQIEVDVSGSLRSLGARYRLIRSVPRLPADQSVVFSNGDIDLRAVPIGPGASPVAQITFVLKGRPTINGRPLAIRFPEVAAEAVRIVRDGGGVTGALVASQSPSGDPRTVVLTDRNDDGAIYFYRLNVVTVKRIHGGRQSGTIDPSIVNRGHPGGGGSN